jgi:hypothetical protein
MATPTTAHSSSTASVSKPASTSAQQTSVPPTHSSTIQPSTTAPPRQGVMGSPSATADHSSQPSASAHNSSSLSSIVAPTSIVHGAATPSQASSTSAFKAPMASNTNVPTNGSIPSSPMITTSYPTITNAASQATTSAGLGQTAASGSTSFFSHHAVVGGVFAVAAVLVLALGACLLLLCRRRARHVRDKRLQRWRRGISWPASAPDSESAAPFLHAPRVPPSPPPMFQIYPDPPLPQPLPASSTDTFGAPFTSSPPPPPAPVSRATRDPFADPPRTPKTAHRMPRVPPPVAFAPFVHRRALSNTSTASRSLTASPFDDGFRRSLDRSSEIGLALTKDASLHTPSFVPEAAPAVGSAQSSPSQYTASLADDADSTRGTERPEPAPRRVSGALPKSALAGLVQTPAPPVPPRHRDHWSTTGQLLTPPSSYAGHSPPASPTAHMSESGLGLRF